MQRQDNNQGFFKRLIKSVTEAINPTKTSEKKTKTKKSKEGFFKRIFKNFRKREGKQKGTTFRTPSKKYSTGGFGWSKEKENYKHSNIEAFNKLKGKGQAQKEIKAKNIKTIDFKGKELTSKDLIKYEKFVDDYNDKIEEIRENLVENVHKYLDPVVASNVELELERAVERDKMRFTNSQFDNLRDLDFEQFTNKMVQGGEEEFERVLDSAYYNPTERYQSYRDSYIKVMQEELGYSTISEEIKSIIEELPLDVFMVSYYDPSGEMHIEVWNPSPHKRGGAYYDNPAIERAEKSLEYFKKLKQKSS